VALVQLALAQHPVEGVGQRDDLAVARADRHRLVAPLGDAVQGPLEGPQRTDDLTHQDLANGDGESREQHDRADETAAIAGEQGLQAAPFAPGDLFGERDDLLACAPDLLLQLLAFGGLRRRRRVPPHQRLVAGQPVSQRGEQVGGDEGAERSAVALQQPRARAA
jgi:hypothetical protein